MKKQHKQYLMLGLLGLGALYLTNLTAGIIEVLPDNLPLVGNADEGVAGAMVYYALSNLLKGR